jgi:hypothetical protein
MKAFESLPPPLEVSLYTPLINHNLDSTIKKNINRNPCGRVFLSGNGLLSTKIKTVSITHSFEVLYATHALVKLFIVDDSSNYSYSIYLVIQ